jgi:hypothetical protein
MRFPWHRRKPKTTFPNPFKDKATLGKFLGSVAAGVFTGELNIKEARQIELLTTDFFKLLTVKDFTFELGDAIEPQADREKLPYAT